MKKFIPKKIKPLLIPFYKKFLIYNFKINRRNKKATIKLLNIEFSNKCNLRCKWCSLDHSKPSIYLSKQILEKLLKEIVYDKRFSKIKELNLWNAGETLLNPNFSSLLNIIGKYKKIGIKKNGRFPKVQLLTNGTMLTFSKSREIINSNALDEIIFSVDGGTLEEYEMIRRGAKWEVLSKNITNFLKLNKNKVKSSIVCLVGEHKSFSIDWMDNSFKELLLLVNSYSLRKPHNWDGSKELGLKKRKKKKLNICYFLRYQLVLLPNGDVTVCCADLNSRGVIGNIKENSLYEIYSSKKRNWMINMNLIGKRKKVPLCQNCELE